MIEDSDRIYLYKKFTDEYARLYNLGQKLNTDQILNSIKRLNRLRKQLALIEDTILIQRLTSGKP
jgi:hypothetical protein